MNRVTNQMINNTMNYNLQRHQKDMDKIQNQLGTGKKVQMPRDNPIATADQMLYKSRLNEIQQFIKNAGDAKSKLNEMDTALQRVSTIFHRLRTLTVQGAHGIYSSFERKEAAATEINQLLKQLVAIGNTKDATGKPIFGGFQRGTQNNPNPFVPVYQTLTAGNQGDAMIKVEYRGNTGKILREVDKGEYLEVNIPGNVAFWGSNQTLTSSKNGSTYRANSNQTIRIDGTEINISAGDNLDLIIDKINHAGLSVKAKKGGSDNLLLETTTPHEIWLEDVGSGTILKDLGMIDGTFSEPPNNIDQTVTKGGMSIFDVIIKLRNDLVRGDQELVGGDDLRLLDMAHQNVLRNLAKVGAMENRVEQIEKKGQFDKANVLELLSKSEGIDMAETIMNFKWLESVHQYALAVGAKSIKRTLMDFLR